MKENTKLKETEIVVVLDRSGSMRSIAEATVKGFNEFLNEQKNADGEGFLTLVQFDDRYEKNYESLHLDKVNELILDENFIPRGSTALLDAIGKTIEELETDRDVVFVIITDGYENASRVYKKEAINKMIEITTKERGWKFLFLGANQDAIKEGGSIGISGANSMTYSSNAEGASAAFASVASNIKTYRSSKFGALSEDDLAQIQQDLAFKDDQREDSKK